MTTRFPKHIRKKIRLLLAEETSERTKLGTQALQMGDFLLDCVKSSAYLCDTEFFYDNDSETQSIHMGKIEDIDDSSWGYLLSILKKKFVNDYQQKMVEYNDDMTLLKRELDAWYGTNPEDGSPASFGKIADLGSSRSDALKQLYAWKAEQLDILKTIQTTCIDFYPS